MRALRIILDETHWFAHLDPRVFFPVLCSSMEQPWPRVDERMLLTGLPKETSACDSSRKAPLSWHYRSDGKALRPKI